MPDLKVKISVKYKDRYDGKFPQLFKMLLDLPTFEYDKTAKIEDADLTAKDVEKEFNQSCKGIFATISYVVDEVLKENKITSKGNVPPSVLKPAQAQINKELTPFKKSLAKLVDGIIDELGGNEVPETGYDPKDDKLTGKYLDSMQEVNAIDDALTKL